MAKKTAVEAPQEAAKRQATEERGPTMEDRFAELSARYKWYFIVPLSILMIAVIVLAVVSGRQRVERRQAAKALRTAKTAADLEAVAAEYSGTFAGRLALVRAGDQLLRDGQYADARAKYEAFLATEPDPLIAIPVRTSVIQTYVQQKDYAGGIDACNALLAAPGRQYAEKQAMYYQGYCYEQLGQLEQAKEWYGKVAPRSDKPAEYYADMQKPWWRTGYQRFSEVTRELEKKTITPEIINVPSPAVVTPDGRGASSS